MSAVWWEARVWPLTAGGSRSSAGVSLTAAYHSTLGVRPACRGGCTNQRFHFRYLKALVWEHSRRLPQSNYCLHVSPRPGTEGSMLTKSFYSSRKLSGIVRQTHRFEHVMLEASKMALKTFPFSGDGQTVTPSEWAVRDNFGTNPSPSSLQRTQKSAMKNEAFTVT